MNSKDVLDGLFFVDSPYPFPKRRTVGMCGKGIDGVDTRLKLKGVAKDAQGALQLNNAPPQRALGLITDNQNDVARVAHAVLQMVENPPAFTHTAGGDDNHGALGVVELLGLIGRSEELQPRHFEELNASAQQSAGSFAITGCVAGIDFGGLKGEGRIHVDGDLRDFSFAEEGI